MVVVKRGMRFWKSLEGKEDEGGRPQHHELANFSKTNSTFAGEWKQDLQVMAVMAT